MRKVIDWIKSNLAIVISGTVAAVSIVFLVLGMMDDRVSKALKADSPMVNNLTSLRPINESMIAVALAEQKRQQRQLQEILNQIKTSKIYKPLIDTVFPTMTEINRLSAPSDFRKAFREKQNSFMTILNAKDRVSTGRSSDFRQSSFSRRPERDDFVSPPIGGMGEPRRSRSDRFGDFETDSPPSATDTPQVSRDDLIHARGMYLYANVNNLDSQNPAVKEVYEGTRPLTIEQMWMAQVSLWIQEDVVEAVRRINEQAAQALDQDKRWVGHLPVKHLKNFNMEGFYQNITDGGTRGRGPSRTILDAFVGPRPADVDAIRFTLTLVVEANILLQVIDELSQRGFYTLLQPTRIIAVQPETASTGYIYGSAPAVEVEMYWEACFLRGAYEQIMPPEIKKMFTSGDTGTIAPDPRDRDRFDSFARPRSGDR